MMPVADSFRKRCMVVATVVALAVSLPVHNVFAQDVQALEDAIMNVQQIIDDPALQSLGPQGNAAQAEEDKAVDSEQYLSDEFKINPNRIPSLMFTFWEYSAIQDARSSVGSVRAPTDAELARDLNKAQREKVKPPPDEREIRLGGIVYVRGDDWTIWLNEQRVTPNAIPPEVLDLQVFKEYIEVKWFDDYTNQIFPIRLRAHQKFNIDSRIFLPGTNKSG